MANGRRQIDFRGVDEANNNFKVTPEFQKQEIIGFRPGEPVGDVIDGCGGVDLATRVKKVPLLEGLAKIVNGSTMELNDSRRYLVGNETGFFAEHEVQRSHS